ncbi:MAG: type II toxin-antitoxin system HicB family antitoxin [Acidobacteria bacterium]|nr:type II toxin-antitoxin system HicB family antitoxin [Acidobacteriota bacterium]
MGKVKYPFVIYPAQEGGYVAEIPALKGCLAQGDTLNETLEELETVETLWLETAVKAGLRLPKVDVEIERVKQRLAA